MKEIFFWMLSSGNFIQQNKTKSRTVNDSKDLCIYVGDCNGTPAFILKASLAGRDSRNREKKKD